MDYYLRPLLAPLLPKLRGQFAEFLRESSFTRLRILISPTCVGLRYRQIVLNLEAFLGSTVSVILHPFRRTSRACTVSETGADLPIPLPTPFDQLFHQLAHLTLSVPPSHTLLGIGILTDLPSPTPFGLGLGPD